jgi:adenylate cyclase
LGEFELRGTAATLRVYELEDAGPVRTRLEVARARGFSRFVGRADEMATLELALNRAQQGDGQVVGVVGEAGVGKSRLCLEFVNHCRARGMAVYDAHCPAHGKAVAFLPLLELLRSLLDVSERDSDQKVRETITGRLILLDREFDESLSLVFEFLGVPDPERPAPQADAKIRQQQLFGFVRRLVERTSARDPCVLLVDDLQWIDSGSDAFLAQIVEVVSGSRTMLLLNFRPEYQAGWMQRSHYHQLPLAPLGEEAIGELLGHLLGDDESIVGLRDLIRERTGGNPFFIEEVVRSLIESESLEGPAGHYRLVTPVERLDVPATVQSVLAARIDRLPEREKRLLQTAAVIGREFPEPILEAVAELPRAELAGALATLKTAEFVRELALYPVAEYEFKHPLTQEVALGSQLQDRRRRTHADVAQAFENLYPEEREVNAALLAYHWEEAGEEIEAARCHRMAGRLVGQSDMGEALRHWQRVRELARGVAESREMAGLGAEACSALLNLRVWLGADEDWEALFQEGIRFAERTGDLRALAELHYGFANPAWAALNVSTFLQSSQEAMHLAEQAGDATLAAKTKLRFAFALAVSGDVEASLALTEELIEAPLLDRADLAALEPQPCLWALNWQGYLRVHQGDLDGGEADMREALALSREPADHFTELMTWNYLIEVAELRGESDGVLDYARAALKTEERIYGPARAYRWSRTTLGLAQILRGEWAAAHVVLEENLDRLREQGSSAMSELVLLRPLALALHGVGETKRALATARQVLETDVNLFYVIVPGCFALSRILRETQGVAALAEIQRTLDRAAAVIERDGLKTLRGFEREERARLARLLGEEAGWRSGLEDAAQIFEESGARKRAEALRQELAS